MINDAATVAARAIRMIKERVVEARDGSMLSIDRNDLHSQRYDGRAGTCGASSIRSGAIGRRRQAGIKKGHRMIAMP